MPRCPSIYPRFFLLSGTGKAFGAALEFAALTAARTGEVLAHAGVKSTWLRRFESCRPTA